MKMIVINVMIVNVTKRPNLLVKRIRNGIEHNVFRVNGSVMAIQTVWMVLMRIRPFITVRLRKTAVTISSDVIMDDASIR